MKQKNNHGVNLVPMGWLGICLNGKKNRTIVLQIASYNIKNYFSLLINFLKSKCLLKKMRSTRLGFYTIAHACMLFKILFDFQNCWNSWFCLVIFNVYTNAYHHDYFYQTIFFNVIFFLSNFSSTLGPRNFSSNLHKKESINELFSSFEQFSKTKLMLNFW